MFDSIIGEAITPLSFLVCILVAITLGLTVAIVDSVVSKKPNKNFAITLATLPALVAVVIMLVNGNIGAGIATLGAFSLVRFRSIPGNSRAIMSIFFSMVIGLATGTGHVLIASIFTIIVSALVLILSAVNFGGSKTESQHLIIVVPEDLDYTKVFDEVFENNLEEYQLLRSKTINMGSLFELKYSIRFKEEVNEKKFLDKIRARNGNLKVSLTHVVTDPEEL